MTQIAVPNSAISPVCRVVLVRTFYLHPFEVLGYKPLVPIR